MSKPMQRLIYPPKGGEPLLTTYTSGKFAFITRDVPLAIDISSFMDGYRPFWSPDDLFELTEVEMSNNLWLHHMPTDYYPTNPWLPRSSPVYTFTFERIKS